MAETVLSNVAGADGKRSLLLPPSCELPNLTVRSNADVSTIAQRAVDQFKIGIEDQGGWRILWHGNKHSNENRCQDVFKQNLIAWCAPYDIDVSAETNIGRGPVDFKVSRGFHSRALLELKLASHRRFWAGLTKQLPQYMRSEGIERGFFVAFGFTEADEKCLVGINDSANQVSTATGYSIDVVYIDARSDNKDSASML